MLSAAESQVEKLGVVTQTLGGKALSTLEKRLRQVKSFLRGPCLAGATACNIGHTEAATLGAHSCKVTRLAWAAKYGLSKDTRTRLGNHNDRGSAECYGRDTLAAPLRDLEACILAIRTGSFLPDVSRSGFFPAARESSPSETVPREARAAMDLSDREP